jgi:porphyrinogen peroxidase
MNTPQGGLLALGTASQAYLEFDLHDGASAKALVQAVASLHEPRTTMGGVNLVAGFRPELWSEVAGGAAPADLTGFNEDLSGVEGFTMPATQHDAVLWVSGMTYDVVFDVCRGMLKALSPVASLAAETACWPYQHDRDLTGFIDGSENPSISEAPDVALVADDSPGAGGSVLLLQKWVHDTAAWEALPDHAQEQVIGRTKPDSVELDPKPADCHVARTDQDQFGDIFRRNMPWGTVREHGTMFVGFCAEQKHLATMLESMAGLTSGARDALTRYTRPVSGAYYFVPSVDDMAGFAEAVSN